MSEAATLPHNLRFLPTPEEIAEACRQIKSEWSAEEERKRRAVTCQRQEWQVPSVGIDIETTDRE